MLLSILSWPSAMQLNEPPSVLPGTQKTVVVFFGMTASGKSTLGEAWAAACQAVYHNTDRVRKELAGLPPTERRPDQVAQGIYSSAFTERTYQALLDRARGNFSQGYALVVLDGSYSRQRDRDQVRRLAREVGARCVFVLCTCSDEEVQRRLDRRACDPEAISDGRWEIYQHQKATFELPAAYEEGECIHLNTEQHVDLLLARLAAHPLFRGCSHQ